MMLTTSDFASSYRVNFLIGHGSFGNVYNATKIDTNEEVAVKEFKGSCVRSFVNDKGVQVPIEIYALRKVQGVQGVIRLLNWYCQGSKYLLVMEKPPNCKDLFDVITEEGRLSEARSRKLLVQLVRAVLGCQENGVIHCDVKEENILIDTQNDDLKLIDFGFANVVGKVEYWAPGTQEYSPPEWITSRSYQPEPAAVWSLGTVLYTMLYGYTPFPSVNLAVQCKIDRRPGLSKKAYDLLTACLTKRPSKRISLVGILGDAWVMEGAAAGFHHIM